MGTLRFPYRSNVDWFEGSVFDAATYALSLAMLYGGTIGIILAANFGPEWLITAMIIVTASSTLGVEVIGELAAEKGGKNFEVRSFVYQLRLYSGEPIGDATRVLKKALVARGDRRSRA